MSQVCNSSLLEVTTKNNIKVLGAFIDNLPLPLLIYKNVFNNDSKINKSSVLDYFKINKWSSNNWGWNSGASTTAHYHDKCHEILIVTNGWANLKWGKNKNISAKAYAGDVIFQPAGLYHCGNGCSNDCYTIGIYPNNSPQWIFNYNGPNKTQLKNINNVKIPTDPVFGGNEISEFAKILKSKM